MTAVNSIGTNAVELTYDTDFASTAAESDLADVGFARFSARDVLNTPENGIRSSEPELHFEAGRIAFESNGTKQIDITDAGNIELTTRSNGDINVATNGTGDVIQKPNLPTSTAGPGLQFGWNSNSTGGAAHIKSVLSVDAGSDDPTTNLLFNEGVQITASSAGDGSTNGGYDSDFSWPTLAMLSNDKHGSLTSPNTDRNTQNQAYGNIWFVKQNIG